jgi:hypothetical protein
MDKSIEKLLVSKLRQPLHKSYICKYILKNEIEECESILNKLVDDDLIIESPLASGYYVVKN